MEPTTGKRKRSRASNLLAHLLAPLFGVLALIYLANPTFGLFELLPDNLPVVGNLDEAGAVLLLTNVLAWYGFNTGARGSNLGKAGRGWQRAGCCRACCCRWPARWPCCIWPTRHWASSNCTAGQSAAGRQPRRGRRRAAPDQCSGLVRP